MNNMLGTVWMIFGICQAMMVASGFAVQINKYEENYIFIKQNQYPKCTLSKESFAKLHLRAGQNFEYFEQGEKHQRMIVRTLKSQEFYMLILEKNQYDNESVRHINYLLEKKSYWSNLFDW